FLQLFVVITCTCYDLYELTHTTCLSYLSVFLLRVWHSYDKMMSPNIILTWVLTLGNNSFLVIYVLEMENYLLYILFLFLGDRFGNLYKLYDMDISILLRWVATNTN
ncbi:hypothetical protein ACJX0J_011958, partial [Zea mays]